MQEMAEHGREWNGSVPLGSLARWGYHVLGSVAEDEDDQQSLEDDLDAFLKICRGSPKKARTHSANHDSGSLSVLFQDPVASKEARPAHGSTKKESKRAKRLRAEEESLEHVLTRSEDKQLYERIVRRVQMAVGKLAVRPMVEAILPGHASAGRAKVSKELPLWHGDYKWLKKEYTPPSLAVILMMVDGVSTLFPLLGVYRRRAFGEAWCGPAEQERLGRLDAHEGRAERWELVYASGSNGGDTVPAYGAYGASIGATPTGQARARAMKTGEYDRTIYGPRDKMPKGEALAFDATGPHRGPGVVQGEWHGGLWRPRATR